MNNEISVIKRNGSAEPICLNKIHDVIEHACAGLNDVSVSEVEMHSHLSFFDGITTVEIHRAITHAAATLISEDSPDYQFVAGRLLNYDIRKTVWGSSTPPPLYDLIVDNIKEGFYTPELLTMYTRDEWEYLDSHIVHDRDLDMPFISIKEFLTKYIVRDRSLKELTPRETPQYAYMMIASLMRSDTKDLEDVISYYNDISTHAISLPTPINAGMRTTVKQFSSCVLIECGDTLDSIGETGKSIKKYVAKKAGIGIGASAIRAEGSKVSGGSIRHTGVIPFFRSFERDVKSCSQGGVRGGAATLHALLWHPEIEDILVLKNNKGTEDNRVRRLDYSILINDYLYERIRRREPLYLFSPADVRDLYTAFFEDPEEFEALYEMYIDDPTITKRAIDSVEIFKKLTIERKETGRIYIMNVDNMNNHSPFLVPIRMSNLCQEIGLPTVPMESVENYSIRVTKDDFIDVVNQLATSPVVKSFKVVGGYENG